MSLTLLNFFRSFLSFSFLFFFSVNLIAIISGGAVVYRRHTEKLTVNGSLSYNSKSGDNRGMIFTWHYGKIKGLTNASLQLIANDSFASLNKSIIQDLRIAAGRVITIDCSFAQYDDTIIVNLTLTKDNRVSSVIQAIYLVRGDPPKVYQR